MKLSVELQNQINQLNQLRKQALKQEQEEQKLFEKNKINDLEHFGKQLNAQRKLLGSNLLRLRCKQAFQAQLLNVYLKTRAK